MNVVNSSDITLLSKMAPSTSIVEYVRPSFVYDLSTITMLPGAATSQPFAAQIVLDEIGKLKDGWDGYGGLAVTKESRAHVRKMIAIAPHGLRGPDITPTSNGTIAVEWQSGQGEAFLEVGCTRYSGHIQPKDGTTIYLQGQLSTQAEETVATKQVLAVIKQLLYGASGANSFGNSIQVKEQAF